MRSFGGSNKIACQQIQCIIKRLYFSRNYFFFFHPCPHPLNTLIVECVKGKGDGKKQSKLDVGVRICLPREHECLNA